MPTAPEADSLTRLANFDLVELPTRVLAISLNVFEAACSPILATLAKV